MKANLFFAMALLAGAAAVGCAGRGSGKVPSDDSGIFDDTVCNEIAKAVDESWAEGNFPGAVVCVTHKGRVVYLEAFGYASVYPDTTLMEPGMMFDLASLSKCFGTTLSMMRLIERGKVGLNDKVSKYIPGFKPWCDPETGETVDITVRDLMTHSSGISAYLSDVDGFVSRHGTHCNEDLIEWIAEGETRHFRPGTDFLYSCLNFITVQGIIERVTGVPLWKFAEMNIFRPLGLRHTCYFPLEEDCLTPAVHKDLAELCVPTEVIDGKALKAAVHDPIARLVNGGNSGNAGVFSNAEDLAVICNALLYPPKSPFVRGPVKGHSRRRILSPETIALMRTIPPENDPSVGRALGWDSQSSHSHIKGTIFNPETVLCHTGYTGTSAVIDFETETVVLILTNRVHPTDDGACGPLRSRVADIVAAAVKKGL